jgi:predicted lipid-binding transport protein (Tim44 family)
VDGADNIAQIIDLWTFEHTVKSKDPTWHLAAARSG